MVTENSICLPEQSQFSAEMVESNPGVSKSGDRSKKGKRKKQKERKKKMSGALQTLVIRLKLSITIGANQQQPGEIKLSASHQSRKFLHENPAQINVFLTGSVGENGLRSENLDHHIGPSCPNPWKGAVNRLEGA